jgi:transposase
MSNTISKHATNWHEGRRLRGWELKEEGYSQQQIADVLGVSKGAVSQWMERGRQGGVEGLKRRVAPGASPRLDDQQRAELAELLAFYDAEDYGFVGKAWTCGRVAAVIRREYGVSYHPSHVSRLLRSLGLSRQKPMRRANQRDEAAIEHWREERWPELKRGQ